MSKAKMLAADTHVHLCPAHDLAAALGAALANLSRLCSSVAPGAEAVLPAVFLTERADCRGFQRILDSAGDLPGGGWSVHRCEEPQALAVDRGPDRLLCFAGRQIVTRERLEVLALATDAEFQDGIGLREGIEAVLAAGGVPVVPWSPGKWFFERGRLVENALRSFSPRQVLVGDSSLRPLGWGEPRLMARARRAGFRVVAGSDPLPFPGEESLIGRYGVLCAGEFDEARPVAGAKRLLTDPAVPLRRAGRRCGPARVLLRLWRNRLAKKAGGPRR